VSDAQKEAEMLWAVAQKSKERDERAAEMLWVVAQKSEERDERAAEMLLEALETDGAHHKQWYIEQALRELMSAGTFRQAKEHRRWTEGVAP